MSFVVGSWDAACVAKENTLTADDTERKPEELLHHRDQLACWGIVKRTRSKWSRRRCDAERDFQSFSNAITKIKADDNVLFPSCDRNNLPPFTKLIWFSVNYIKWNALHITEIRRQHGVTRAEINERCLHWVINVANATSAVYTSVSGIL